MHSEICDVQNDDWKSVSLAITIDVITGLRYHSERHVRCLAAETFGFLLRAASPKQQRQALRAVLAEHAVKPTAARCHGGGLLAAEAVLGVEHGLHSKVTLLITC
jgi:U3 small nucleolar RNA-associated protein 20